MIGDLIPHVRRFYRLVTQRAGVLEARYLGRNRPLGESRVLYEIGPEGNDLRALRARLGLDSGYLSRVVRALQADGLIKVRPGPNDARVRHVAWTRAGRAEVNAMNRLSDQAAERVLSPLSEGQRARLVAAMDEVHRLLRLAGLQIVPVDPASPAARACVAAYCDELALRFERGFDPRRSISADDAELRPPGGLFLMGQIDGAAVACGALKTLAPGLGSLKRLWVTPDLRGLGVGRRMLSALEAQARELGHTRLRLETNRVLKEGIQLYRSAGYRQVRRFNDDPYADFFFEKKLPV